MGSGCHFIIIVTQVAVTDKDSRDSALVDEIYSGILTSKGIKNYYYALYMVNNYGHTSGQWIDDGQVRIFCDKHGISEKTNKKIWLHSGLSTWSKRK